MRHMIEPGRIYITDGTTNYSVELVDGGIALLRNGEAVGEVRPLDGPGPHMVTWDDVESLRETVEILSDPLTMEALWDGEDEFTGAVLDSVTEYEQRIRDNLADEFIAAHECRVCGAYPATRCGHVKDCTLDLRHAHCPALSVGEHCVIQHSHCVGHPPF